MSVRSSRAVLRTRLGRAGAVALAAALLFAVQVTRPDGVDAFAGIPDPAVFVFAAQYTSLVGENMRLKRTAENVRDLHKAIDLGKIAPLRGRLSTVARSLNRSMAAASNGGVRGFLTSAARNGQPVRFDPFNRVKPICATPSPAARDDCASPLPPADAIERSYDFRSDRHEANTRGLFQEATYSFSADGAMTVTATAHQGALPAALVQARAAHEARARAIRQQYEDVHMPASGESFDDRTYGARRAAVASAMNVIEEWRGCVAAVPGQPLTGPAAGALPPCAPGPDGVTAGGVDTEAFETPDATGNLVAVPAGTKGYAHVLREQLDFIDTEMPGADVAVNQHLNMQTRLALTHARINAARAELAATEIEIGQQAMLAGQMRERRAQELFAARIECRENPGTRWPGVTPSRYNRLVPSLDGNGSAADANTVCLQYNDVAAQRYQAAAAAAQARVNLFNPVITP